MTEEFKKFYNEILRIKTEQNLNGYQFVTFLLYAVYGFLGTHYSKDLKGV
jgi:hypothetical protein